MKKMIWYCVCAGLLAVLLPVRGMAAENNTLLVEEMEALHRSFRILKRQYEIAAQNTNATAKANAPATNAVRRANVMQPINPSELMEAIQRHALIAVKITPEPVANLGAAAQAKHLDVFRKDLNALLKQVGALQKVAGTGSSKEITSQVGKLDELERSSFAHLNAVLGRKPQNNEN